MSALDLDAFAFAGQPEGDAELFALMAEYRRLSARATELYGQAKKLEAERGIEGLRTLQIGSIVYTDGQREPLYAFTRDEIPWGNPRQQQEARRRDAGCIFTLSCLGDRQADAEAKFDAQRREMRAIMAASGIDALWREQEAVWTEAGEVGGKIDEVRPTTLRGVLALFDFAVETDADIAYWPTKAIEGLRNIMEREAQP
jgi:hypothetical protein